MPMSVLQVILEDCELSYNRAEFGGGLDVWKGVTILGSTFRQNEALQSGGGVYAQPNALINIKTSNFSSNNASWGGGVYCEGCRLHAINAVFNSNTVVEDGAGVTANDGARVSCKWMSQTTC